MELKKVSRFIKATLVAVVLLISCYSCTTDEYINEYHGPDWNVKTFEVRPNMWTWNSYQGWYECVVKYPELTEFVYENGVVLAQVFMGIQGVDEVQRTLPYLQSYYDEQNRVYYTRNISYDYNIGSVCFYYQDSDLTKEVISDTFSFKVTLFW